VYSGTGDGAVDLCLLMEETAYGQLPVNALGASLFVAGAYRRFVTDAQKQTMLSGIVAGDVEAIAMSEPETGSDVGSLKCGARRDGDEWVINGQKTWITAAHCAEHILLVCRTGGGAKHDGISMISVPRDAAGMEVRQIQTMGGHGRSTTCSSARRACPPATCSATRATAGAS
jgi:isovaleryl-CoA dehydrogenase